MKSAGQYQVVIGNHVPLVYADVCELAGISNGTQQVEEEAPQGLFNKLIDIISGCFQPILGPLCAAGIIKGYCRNDYWSNTLLSNNSNRYIISCRKSNWNITIHWILLYKIYRYSICFR